MKVTRTLNEMNSDIQKFKDEIKKVEDEIKIFQSECPHPKNFSKEKRTSYSDEYGRTEGYFYDKTCLLCGHKEHWREEEKESRSRY